MKLLHSIANLQTETELGAVHPVLGHGERLRIPFNSDGMEALAVRSLDGGSASHEWIQHRSPWWGDQPAQVGHQCEGLRGRVRRPLTLSPRRLGGVIQPLDAGLVYRQRLWQRGMVCSVHRAPSLFC